MKVKRSFMVGVLEHILGKNSAEMQIHHLGICKTMESAAQTAFVGNWEGAKIDVLRDSLRAMWDNDLHLVGDEDE